MDNDRDPKRLSSELSAIAILVHTAIEELNPAAADTEYYDCKALDCDSGLGIAVNRGWVDSGSTQNPDGSFNNLFKVKLTKLGRAKVEAMRYLVFQR